MVGFIYIDTKEELAETAGKWNEISDLAIDIECENNLHHYGAYVSLIQISDGKENWIVDVLKLKEIKPLLEVLENPRVLKVFHDVSFDFRILNNEFHCRPRNIFDTLMAAQLLGKENIGLASLLEEYLHIKKEVKMQTADWTRRPLSSEMLSYAAKDVMYLVKLKDLLEEELKKKERLSWVKEEFEEIEKTEFIYKESDFWEISGMRQISPEQLGVFKKLFLLRSRLAKMVDRPVHFVISNRLMRQLAVDPPQNWEKLRGVHPIVRQNARQFEEAVSEGKKMPVFLPKKKRIFHSSQQKLFFEKLYELQAKAAEKIAIKGHLIINKEQMDKIVTERKTDCLRNWQKELLEKEGLDELLVKL